MKRELQHLRLHPRRRDAKCGDGKLVGLGTEECDDGNLDRRRRLQRDLHDDLRDGKVAGDARLRKRGERGRLLQRLRRRGELRQRSSRRR